MPICTCGRIYPLGATCDSCGGHGGSGSAGSGLDFDASPDPLVADAGLLGGLDSNTDSPGRQPQQSRPKADRGGGGAKLRLHGIVSSYVEEMAGPSGLGLANVLLALLVVVAAAVLAGTKAPWLAVIAFAIGIVLVALLVAAILGRPGAVRAVGLMVAEPRGLGRVRAFSHFRLQSEENGPVSIIVADSMPALELGDEVTVEGYQTRRAVRAARLDNHTVGDVHRDFTPAVNLAFLAMISVFWLLLPLVVLA